MTNKTNWLGIIAFVCAAAFTGCPAEDEALIRKELYSVKITSVTPEVLTAGMEEQQVAVTVEYNLQINLRPNCQLIVAFNTEDLDGYRIYQDSFIDITEKGSGTHTFNTVITPADWSAANGTFQVRASYGFDAMEIGQVAPDVALASDTKAISLHQDENFRSVTWHLNGGEGPPLWLPEYRYPRRVANGAVLAKPYNPTKIRSRGYGLGNINYYFSGWYTDSALTQPYNFANSVTAGLNLYAKWEAGYPKEYLYGTWKHIYDGNNYAQILTISADTVTIEDSLGRYTEYTNVQWSQAENTTDDVTYTKNYYPIGYGFTGTVTTNNDNTTYNFVAMSTVEPDSDWSSVFLLGIIIPPSGEPYITSYEYRKWEGDKATMTFELIASGKNADTYRVRKDVIITGDIVIPAEYNGKPVTEIGAITDRILVSKGAFENTVISSVTIPDSVNTIGGLAFLNCPRLATATIPDSVTAIGEWAFGNCTRLTSITIPASVTTVGEVAFWGWTASQTINVPWAEGDRPSGWHSYWNQNCNAQIVYQQ